MLTTHWVTSEERLSIIKKTLEHCNRNMGSGRRRLQLAYYKLGNSYSSLGDLRKAIEYNDKDLNIAIEIRDGAGEGLWKSRLRIRFAGCIPKSH